jgi:predicted Zn-dependent protease
MSRVDEVYAALDRLGRGCVILRAAHTQNLRWANSALTTNGDTMTTSMTVIAMEPAEGGSRVAVSTGQVAGPDDAAQLAAGCAGAVRRAPVTDAADLISGEEVSGFGVDPHTIAAARTDVMQSAVGAFLGAGGRQFGYAELDSTTTYLATTAGVCERHVQDTTRLESSSRDAAGSTWWGANHLRIDPEAVNRQAQERLALQSGREDAQPGRHRVILTPSAVADLLIYLAWSASGRDAVEGHNVFSRPGGATRLGEALTARRLDLYADPKDAELTVAPTAVVDANSSMESVFDNGLPLHRADLISGGVLTALRASRPTAARFGLRPLYLADNLICEDRDGDGTLEELVARTDDAILINCLWYIREVDPQNLLLTGLTRDGVYRVRDGRIVGAWPNFRFNVAVTDVLARIVDASAPTSCLPREWADWFTRTRMPALLVDGFNLSSVSEAL